MKTKRKWVTVVLVITAIIVISAAATFLLPKIVHWGFARTVSPEETALRQKYVDSAFTWLGVNSEDGSHRKIVDIYNANTPLAMNYTVKYTDKWCAAFVSTVAIECGLTQWIPTECGCQRQIGLLADLGCWEENDAYVPLPGDLIFYSSEGAGISDNTGWSDHVGIVAGTWGNYIKVIEGNVMGAVAVRYVSIGDPRIRGYGLPDYADACKE